MFVKEKQELKTGEGKGLENWPALNCLEQDDPKLIEPLYSLLLTLSNPTVDFLSLDIEGADFQVLRTIPWDKGDI